MAADSRQYPGIKFSININLLLTKTILTNYSSPLGGRLHIKFGFDYPSSGEEKMFESTVHIHVYSPKAGSDNPLGSSMLHTKFRRNQPTVS